MVFAFLEYNITYFFLKVASIAKLILRTLFALELQANDRGNFTRIALGVFMGQVIFLEGLFISQHLINLH
jgi:hypothetical protein